MVVLHVGCAPFGAITPGSRLEHVSEIRDGGSAGTYARERGYRDTGERNGSRGRATVRYRPRRLEVLGPERPVARRRVRDAAARGADLLSPSAGDAGGVWRTGPLGRDQVRRRLVRQP